MIKEKGGKKKKKKQAYENFGTTMVFDRSQKWATVITTASLKILFFDKL